MLTPVFNSPRSHTIVDQPTPEFRRALCSGGVTALDLETNGLDPTAEGARIVGVGLANANGVWYLPVSRWSTNDVEHLWAVLDGLQLVSHNVAFDGVWLLRHAHCWYEWYACTLVLFKQLATEGWKGQRWGVEAAQLNLLGWDGTNKEELTTLLHKHGLTKATMWRLDELEPEAFARYCAQDAETSWQLLHLFEGVKSEEWGLTVWQWHSRFLTQIQLIAEQQLRGIVIDVDSTRKYAAELGVRAYDLELEFLNHSDVQLNVAEWNEQVVAAVRAKEPTRRDLWHQHRLKEPPNRTKSGERSKRWEQWYSRRLEIEAGPRYNAQWLAWSERLRRAETEQHFNTNSRDQLCWLFFERLGFEPTKQTDEGEDALDSKVLRQCGEPGKLLLRYRKTVKELGYVNACLEFTRDGVFRPTIRPHGTITGRIAGGFG